MSPEVEAGKIAESIRLSLCGSLGKQGADDEVARVKDRIVRLLIQGRKRQIDAKLAEALTTKFPPAPLAILGPGGDFTREVRA
jgi:hypothetical protein